MSECDGPNGLLWLLTEVVTDDDEAVGYQDVNGPQKLAEWPLTAHSRIFLHELPT